MASHAIQGAQLTYCFCDFHPGCVISLVEIGGVGYVVCAGCHKMGHIDLVGHRVEVAECKEKASHG